MPRREHVQQSVTYEHNGVKYTRLEDMPPDVRKMFIDKDGNGVPDAFESLLQDRGRDGSQVFTTQRRVTTTVTNNHASRVAASGEFALARAVAELEPLETIHCVKCGYDLKGTAVGSKCPECGYAVAQSIQQMVLPSPSSSQSVLAFLMRNPRLVSSIITLFAVLAVLVFLKWVL